LGLAPSIGILFGGLLVGGLGSAAYHPIGAAFARSAGADRASVAVSLFGAGGTVGMGIGQIIAVTFVASSGLGSTPWLMLPGLAIATLLWFFAPSRIAPRVVPGARRSIDARLLFGPLGLLALTGVASGLAFLTFTSAMPMWLVSVRGVPRDAALIGWTLAAFSLAAAAGGITAAALTTRFSRRALVVTSMLLAPIPLFATFQFEPGSVPYFAAVIAAGALAHAGLPLKVVVAQELAPHSVATASGMVLGFATGVSDLLYVGIGHLQDTVGLAQAMSIRYLAILPGCVASRRHTRQSPTGGDHDGREPRSGGRRRVQLRRGVALDVQPSAPRALANLSYVPPSGARW
jgi:FSR family fosmidomycin resistance protein-like MFS transporter